MILLVGPIAIVVASFAVTGALRSDPPTSATPNDVLLAGRGVVYGADLQSARPTARSLQKPCDESAKRLQKNLGEGCHVLSRPPFVIAGDMTEYDVAKGWTLSQD